MHRFSVLGALQIGLEILFEQEHVKVDRLLGHGGFVKTKEVGRRGMAAAMNEPISVMGTADEGGAWGIMLLASCMRQKTENEPFEVHLSSHVFAGEDGAAVAPDHRGVDGLPSS